MLESAGSKSQRVSTLSGRRIRRSGVKAVSPGFRGLTFERLEDRTVLSALAPTVHAAAKAAGSAALPASSFLSVPNRVDMVADSLRNVLYISTSDGDVLRYDWGHQTWLSPFSFGGYLGGIDISPDQNTLAVTYGSYLLHPTTFYTVNLVTGARSAYIMDGASDTYSVAFAGNSAVLVEAVGFGELVDLATGSGGGIPSVQPTMLYRSAGAATVAQPYPSLTTTLCASADHSVIAVTAQDEIRFASLYQVSSGNVKILFYESPLPSSSTVSGIAPSRDGSQYAVQTNCGTCIYDQNGTQLGLIGPYFSFPVGWRPGVQLN